MIDETDEEISRLYQTFKIFVESCSKDELREVMCNLHARLEEVDRYMNQDLRNLDEGEPVIFQMFDNITRGEVLKELLQIVCGKAAS